MVNPPNMSVCVCMCVYEAVWALLRGQPAGLGCGGFTARHISSSQGGFGLLRPKVDRVLTAEDFIYMQF